MTTLPLAKSPPEVMFSSSRTTPIIEAGWEEDDDTLEGIVEWNPLVECSRTSSQDAESIVFGEVISSLSLDLSVQTCAPAIDDRP